MMRAKRLRVLVVVTFGCLFPPESQFVTTSVCSEPEKRLNRRCVLSAQSFDRTFRHVLDFLASAPGYPTQADKIKQWLVGIADAMSAHLDEGFIELLAGRLCTLAGRGRLATVVLGLIIAGHT